MDSINITERNIQSLCGLEPRKVVKFFRLMGLTMRHNLSYGEIEELCDGDWELINVVRQVIDPFELEADR